MSSVGDVRGLGLFFAVEIVKNRKTKQLFNTMRDKVEGKPLVVDQIVGQDDGAGRGDSGLGQPLRYSAPADCH